MITQLRGRLVEKNPTQAVVDCNGVGYLLHISLHTYSALGADENILIYTHLVVREDAQILYGFATKEERETFRQLISVSGVGPSTAQMICSSLTPGEIRKAILDGNVGLLKSIKGIGAKSAERLIVDLRDKIGKSVNLAPVAGMEAAGSVRDEAVAALAQLGINRVQAERAVEKGLKEAGQEGRVEDVIKVALKNL
ncbi:MAG: Holliday junction branch migration protein RuvA [Flavobacteriales bacterium]|nr:Holliday junction branch migration protein RuvA [Flavobacteriales bacterium]MCB9449245.1 Holliday junction branch migration protein RuvA [Flavobacteriales bacterium]